MNIQLNNETIVNLYKSLKETGVLSQICDDLLKANRAVVDQRTKLIVDAFEKYRAAGMDSREAVQLIADTYSDLFELIS